MSKISLAIAPIAWTNDDLPELGAENTFEQCISEMALAGFTGTEVGNKYPRDTDVLRKALEMRGLRVASAWTSLFLTTKPFEETERDFIAQRDFLKAMGADVIVVAEQGHSIQGLDEPVFDNQPQFTDEEWDRLTTGLERLGELAAETGQRIVYHHHMGTGVQSAAEIDRLMENTDPEKVSLLLDTGHLTFAGEDPMAVAEKHFDRIGHVHLKDIRPDVLQRVKDEKMSFLDGVKAGVFTVPGDGFVEIQPVVKKFADSDYEGWFVVEAEQDPALANPLEYALMARDYIRNTTGI
ncbi:myo-inosose-2 dehydratase [Actinomycetaceae bacterium WB03_NA08]|uniref:Myo-inosose-2 dehydratase n=1 Tax=Scrofimicrobium canadense TaxID=2652290 RepID=A0A6N7W3U3_9ACTO|nr:myo-inosose-2 dehydratase [Scrofimicrobium canadense]MSS84071.1 myo-inosose-2 dehydratase [Scrofimicrobium canadense]